MAAVITKRSFEDNDGCVEESSKRQAHQYPPSSADTDAPIEGKVLLLRDMGDHVVETHIHTALAHYNGSEPPKVFLQRSANNGNQAFVEMRTPQHASSFLAIHNSSPITIGGDAVNVVISKRTSVTEKLSADTKICLLTVDNLQYPVTLQIIHGLLSRVGSVEKIVCFSRKPGIYQALIQFRDGKDSAKAIEALSGRHMYDGCNTIQISPSKLTEVNVRSNDKDKAWDFTLQPFISTDPNDSLISPGGGVTASTGMSNGNLPFAPTPQQYPGQQSMPGGRPNMPFGQPNPMAGQGPMQMQSMQMQGVQRTGVAMGGSPQAGGRSPVLIVYNVPHEHVTPTHLFNLFSLYGPVIRIKMCRDKPDTALVQYSDPSFADLARGIINEVTLFGKRLQTASSKNFDIKMPMRQDDEPSQRKTVEFNLREQRYKQDENFRYEKSACAPTTTLFMANIGDQATEEDIRALVEQHVDVKGIRLKQLKPENPKRIAFIGTASAEESANALCVLHNTPLHGSHVKLAFSKTPVT